MLNDSNIELWKILSGIMKLEWSDECLKFTKFAECQFFFFYFSSYRLF